MQLSSRQVAEFRETVWSYYREHRREMPWRTEPTPYHVLLSELMLQQTQVSRVVPKYAAFLYTCPDIASLAKQPLSVVLGLWAGLGYNRRAKFLHQAAQMVMSDFDGTIPNTTQDLVRLPGVGKNTAGAIMAYAYNQPVMFVETNIRTVLFHHFYADHPGQVTDKELESLVEQTLDREQPRQWYWALMDYGSFLKRTAGGRLQSSRHYKKQSPLKGSLREMRGRIVSALSQGVLNKSDLEKAVNADERFAPALRALTQEGLVQTRGLQVCLTGDIIDAA